MMLAPGPTAATVEDAIAAEVEAVEHELRRVDARIRSLGWGVPSPRRLSVAEQWGAFAGTLEPVDYGDGDGSARQVLEGKRTTLLEELRRLRERLTGQAGGTRRGWG